MKRHLTIFKSLLFLFALTAINNGFGDDPCVEEPNDKKPAKPAEVRNHFLPAQPIAALLWY